MTRTEAFAVGRQHGGKPSQAVTKQTKLLIVGELDWPLLASACNRSATALATVLEAQYPIGGVTSAPLMTIIRGNERILRALRFWSMEQSALDSRLYKQNQKMND